MTARKTRELKEKPNVPNHIGINCAGAILGQYPQAMVCSVSNMMQYSHLGMPPEQSRRKKTR